MQSNKGQRCTGCVSIGWDQACGAAAEKRHRKACGTAAKCWELIHGAALACRRDKLWMHQAVFEVGGAVRDDSVFLFWNYYFLHYVALLFVTG